MRRIDVNLYVDNVVYLNWAFLLFFLPLRWSFSSNAAFISTIALYVCFDLLRWDELNIQIHPPVSPVRGSSSHTKGAFVLPVYEHLVSPNVRNRETGRACLHDNSDSC